MFCRLQQLSNRPLVPTTLTALIYGLFLFARLAAHDFEPSYFVVVGTNRYDASSAHASLRALRNGEGYDGQFYYRLAIEPFSKKSVDHGISFDAPAYRQQRILYPILAWILSAGNPAWVPVALIILNYIGLWLIAWLGASLAISAGRHALWGVAFSLYPGFTFTLSRDLTEIVASTFFLAGLLFVRRSCHRGSATCLSLAVLARETTLVVSVAMMVKCAFAPTIAHEKRHHAWYYAVPIVLYAAWRAYLHSTWAGFPDVRVFGGAIGAPFYGLADLWDRAFATPTRLLVVWCMETCMIGVLALRGIQVFYRYKDFVAENVALILYTAIGVCLASKYWVEDQTFLRVTTEIFLLGLVGLLLDRTRTSLSICFMWIVAAVFTFGWRIEW